MAGAKSAPPRRFVHQRPGRRALDSATRRLLLAWFLSLTLNVELALLASGVHRAFPFELVALNRSQIATAAQWC